MTELAEVEVSIDGTSIVVVVGTVRMVLDADIAEELARALINAACTIDYAMLGDGVVH
jgi:hypothetical protein